MYGVIPVEPDLPGADLAVLFMHNQGYSTMCGHATIALGRFAVDTALVEPTPPVTRLAIQCPCGLVDVSVETQVTPAGVTTGAVRFLSVPSFAAVLGKTVEVPGLPSVPLDIGYGGAFYALVAAPSIGLDLDSTPLPALVDAADRITKVVQKEVAVEHPDDPDLAFLYGTILTDGRDAFEDRPTRNLCVFAEREVDRSPTGSGVSARIAVQLARGQIAMGQTRRFESVTGAHFTGSPIAAAAISRKDGVRVEVGGRAHYTGRSNFTLESGDSLGAGFLLR
jgi:trans-L-3-hydroxyproline dehydratase